VYYHYVFSLQRNKYDDDDDDDDDDDVFDFKPEPDYVVDIVGKCLGPTTSKDG